MADRNIVNDLAGNTIKEIFNRADEIAQLHACLTSTRGGNFRLRLLQAMEVPLDEMEIEKMRVESQIHECHRHLCRLKRFGLMRVEELEGRKQYLRTSLGEKAINALREFERRIGKEAAESVYTACLGPNSTRFFLRIYGDKKEMDWEYLQIRYTPTEIGKMSLFLPRVIEGISAIDKLNEAKLLVYQDDNYICMQPVKARSFYQYLQVLHEIVQENSKSVEAGEP